MNCKALLIGWLLAGAAVAADKPTVVGSIANAAGGEIVLGFTSTRECAAREMLFAYSKNRQGRIIHAGCWKIEGESVFVFWDDGDVYEYNGLLIRYTDAFLKWTATQPTSGART